LPSQTPSEEFGGGRGGGGGLPCQCKTLKSHGGGGKRELLRQNLLRQGTSSFWGGAQKVTEEGRAIADESEALF